MFGEQRSCPKCGGQLEQNFIPEQPPWHCEQCDWHGKLSPDAPHHDLPRADDAHVLGGDGGSSAPSTEES